MKRFSNILFVAEAGTDNSPALRRALSLAENNQASLTVVGTVKEGSAKVSGQLRDALIAEETERLAVLADAVQVSPMTLETRVLLGTPFVEIIREVLDCDFDLVIKAIAESSMRLFGGTDSKLLRKCPCPVWLVQPTQQKDYRAILVAVDEDPENAENAALNEQLLEMATSLALSEFAQLHVVHAWQLEHENAYRSPRLGLSAAEVDAMAAQEEQRRRRWLENITAKFADRTGTDANRYLQAELHLVKGPAEEAVPQLAREVGAELVVMGTVGRTGIPGFVIGNTAEAILSQIDCSVLTVKPAGFISPVSDGNRR